MNSTPSHGLERAALELPPAAPVGYADTLEAVHAEVLRVSAIFEAEGRSQDGLRFLDRFQGAFDTVNFAVVQDSTRAVAARASWRPPFALQAGEGLLRLLSALRAFQGDGEFVFDGHAGEGTSAGGAR